MENHQMITDPSHLDPQVDLVCAIDSVSRTNDGAEAARLKPGSVLGTIALLFKEMDADKLFHQTPLDLPKILSSRKLDTLLKAWTLVL